MAANVSVIGRATRVRGRVTGAADLEVRGFVEGDISVSGDVTIDAQGMVGGGVRGRRLIVRGAVKGDLVGQEAILLEDGARVLGDLRAPRVAIAPGALARGFVETGEEHESPQAREVRPQVVPRGAPASAAARVAPAGPARPPATTQAPAPGTLPKPVPAKPVAATVNSTANSVGNSASVNSSLRRPPPPIVPALKKAKGQIAKRRER